MRRARLHAQARVRAGSAYIMVLASSVIVTAITLGGLALNRAQRDAYQAQQDLRRARMAAASGLEASTQILSPTVDGRVAMSDPVDLPAEIDGVQLMYDIFDTIDASLTNDIAQPIAVTVEARSGTARQMITGSMSPRLTPIGMARYGLAATAGIKLTSTSVDVAAGVYSGTGVNATGASIAAPVYSVGNMTGSTYYGTSSHVTTASSVDVSDPTGLYAAATPISYNSLPGGEIQNVVFSSAINPFGAATNARGIYLIDCEGQRLHIRNSRIIGTLIVLNAKADSLWEGGVNATAYDPRLPAIVWMGGLTVSTDGADLAESTIGTSLNPPGASYLGQADTDTLDQFPSLVTGSMVVIGDLDISGTLSVDGRVIVVGNVVASNATIRIRQDPDEIVPDYLREADGFEFIAGSVAREVEMP